MRARAHVCCSWSIGLRSRVLHWPLVSTRSTLACYARASVKLLVICIVLLPTPKQPHLQRSPPTDFMEALTGLINTYSKTDHWNSDNTSNTCTNHNRNNQTEEGPRQRKRLSKEGHTSRRTLKKRTYRKNRHGQKLIQTNTKHTISHDTNHDNFDCQNNR